MAKSMVPDTAEAWENGSLGRDEAYVAVIEDQEAESGLINQSLALQPISIRLEKSLIEDFKIIAELNGLGGYQTLMRQVLKRFADCEKKKILREMASQALTEAEDKKHDDPPVETKKKKVA